MKTARSPLHCAAVLGAAAVLSGLAEAPGIQAQAARLTVPLTSAKVYVVLPAVITNQPTDQSLAEGATYRNSVGISDTMTAGYQWYFNGQPLPGKTGSSLVISNIRTNHAGTYFVVVTKACNPEGITSRVATLRVGYYVTIAPPYRSGLNMIRSHSTLTLRWQGGGQLERATSLKGPWQSVTATTPYTTSMTGSNAFFRATYPRPVRVYVPSSYDGQSPLPLILLLHGYTSYGGDTEAYFKLLPLAESRNFLYCYPDGTPNTQGWRFWNAGEACCNFYGSAVDDAAYLRELIEAIARTLAVDRRRVHLVGHSNGGFMAYRMACQHSDLIAGIASLAGTMTRGQTNPLPSEPVHVLHIHGTADSAVYYQGGRLSTSVPGVTMTTPAATGALETLQLWAGYNGCQNLVTDASPSLDLDSALPGLDTLVTRYSPSPPGGAIELWQILRGSHVPTVTAEFAPRMVDWLLAHPKP